jgi:hypothetical protein
VHRPHRSPASSPPPAGPRGVRPARRVHCPSRGPGLRVRERGTVAPPTAAPATSTTTRRRCSTTARGPSTNGSAASATPVRAAARDAGSGRASCAPTAPRAGLFGEADTCAPLPPVGSAMTRGPVRAVLRLAAPRRGRRLMAGAFVLAAAVGVVVLAAREGRRASPSRTPTRPRGPPTSIGAVGWTPWRRCRPPPRSRAGTRHHDDRPVPPCVSVLGAVRSPGTGASGARVDGSRPGFTTRGPPRTVV